MQKLKKDLAETLKTMLKYYICSPYYDYSQYINLDRIKCNTHCNVVHLYFNDSNKDGVDLKLLEGLEHYIGNLLNNICEFKFYICSTGGDRNSNSFI